MTRQGFLVRLGMTGRARNDEVAKPTVILNVVVILNEVKKLVKSTVILNEVKNLTILKKGFLVKLGMTVS